MVEMIFVCAFMAMTMPMAILLVAMATAAPERTPEWKPASYQPMAILMAQQTLERKARARKDAPAIAA